MKKRTIILLIMFTFAWTFPLTHSVEVDVKVGKPVEKPVQTQATWQQKKANKAMAMRYAQAGWGWSAHQRECVYSLFMAESKFDHLAKNSRGSSAFGIAQMLGEMSKSPEIQVLHAYKYIEHRYSTPCRAWSFHKRNGFY